MAITGTVFDEYRLPYNQQKADLYEHRLANYGLYEAFKEDTPNTLNAPLLAEMKKAQGQTTSYPVINRKDATVTTTRSCTLISHASTSAFVNVTFTTARTGFHMIPSQYQYNFVDYMSDFSKKMLAVERACLETLDAAAYTAMNNARSQVNRADGNLIVGHRTYYPVKILANIRYAVRQEDDMFVVRPDLAKVNLRRLQGVVKAGATAGSKGRYFYGDKVFFKRLYGLYYPV